MHTKTSESWNNLIFIVDTVYCQYILVGVMHVVVLY